ncbi:MAG: type II secretion system protein GspM [Ottowia sp.]|uniref:type II secretion system protein GspM n=1 Tax=Ottowia sp. TaxID=1898956 RepID=UPI0039E6567F
MTPNLRAQRPETLWLLAGGALLLLALAWASWTVVSKYLQASARLAELEPRHARLAGLLQGSERFVQAEGAVQANLAQFVYPAEGDPSQTGNAALQRVRELAAARGLRVSSSQAAAPREDQGFDRIGLNLRVEGEWPQLVELLRELPQQRPIIHYAAMQIGVQQSGRQQPGAPQPVFGQFDLYVLKERKP